MHDTNFSVGQRVRVLQSATIEQVWDEPGEPGTIVDVYTGDNISGYHVQLDSDNIRTVFCTSEELRPMEASPPPRTDK
jgi:hypothetical protein